MAFQGGGCGGLAELDLLKLGDRIRVREHKDA